MGKHDETEPPDAPRTPERDDVYRHGLRRSGRQQVLWKLGQEVRAACNEDDAPDQVVGMMAVVVRLDAKGKPSEVRRFCTVWGTPGFEALCQASEDTLKHIGRRLMASRAEEQN